MTAATTTPTLAVLAILCGCGKTDRGRDCDDMRVLVNELDRAGPRYYDWGPALERMRQHEWRDPDVHAAAQLAFTPPPAPPENGSGWTLDQTYAHGTAAGSSAIAKRLHADAHFDRLLALCGLDAP